MQFTADRDIKFLDQITVFRREGIWQQIAQTFSYPLHVIKFKNPLVATELTLEYAP